VQYWDITKAATELPRIFKQRGLHPGDKFQTWIKMDVLVAHHITSTEELTDHMMKLDTCGLKIREGTTHPEMQAGAAYTGKAVLKLVTSDIVTQTKVVFPGDANLYYEVRSIILVSTGTLLLSVLVTLATGCECRPPLARVSHTFFHYITPRKTHAKTRRHASVGELFAMVVPLEAVHASS
jgi:hypothetical protein